ncbi:MAG: AsmA-like C-terminal domain-containing protein [Parvibaculum sp.]|nr:AsmA-like C-terminal domain-containing protein [Parvibaculum sp.]
MSKIVLEVVGVAVAVTAVLLAYLAWNLSSGPVSLPILSQIFEDTITGELDGGTIDIGDTILKWSPERRQVDLRVVDLKLMGADGNEVAALPELSFRLSVTALMRGQIAPTTVELYGVKTTLIRRATGFTLGLAPADAPVDTTPQDDIIGPMIETLVQGKPTVRVLSHLRRFAVHDATLHVIDEVNGVTFEAPYADFEIYRGRGGLAARLNADMTFADKTASIQLEGALPQNEPVATVRMTATNVVPADLARMSPAFRNYGMIDAAMSASGELDITREGEVLSARLVIDSGKGRFTIPGLAQAPVDLEKAHAELTLNAQANRVDVKELSLQAGPHNIDLTGHANYVMGEGANVSAVTLDLKAGKTTTEIAGFFEGPVTFDDIAFLGTLNLDERSINVENVTLGVAGGKISASGIVSEGPRSPAIKAKATIGTIPINEARKVWPLVLSKKSRAWVVKNLSDGTLEGADFSIDVPVDLLAIVEEEHIPIPDGGLRFAFRASGATVRYIEAMPPLMSVTANGVVGDNRFDAWVTSAIVNVAPGKVLAVSAGHFADAELSNRRSIGEIEFTGTGKTADILELLNHEPLNLLRKFGIDHSTIGGEGSVSAALRLPLVKGVTLDEIDFKGKAHADNVSIPDLQPDLSITAGTLDVEVSRTGLKSVGNVTLNGAAPLDLVWTESFVKGATPSSSYTLTGNIDNAGRNAVGLKFDKFIDGPATINATITGNGSRINRAKVHADLTPATVTFNYLGWVKPVGEKVMLDVDIALEPEHYAFNNFKLVSDETGPKSSRSVDTHGDFVMNKSWDWMRMNFPQVKLGPKNDINMRGRRDEAGTLIVDINGPKADASGLLHNFVAGDGDQAAAEESALRIITPDMIADPARRTVLRAAIGDVTGLNDTRFANLDAKFTLTDDLVYAFVIDGIDGAGAPLNVSIQPSGLRSREFLMSSTDAGLIFRGLDFAKGITGGTLDAKATLDDTLPGSPMKGEINVTKFRITNAPVLAKILTLGSFTGIGDTMAGEGIWFEKLVLPFRASGHRIYIEEARMSGPAIGLSAQGQIDRTIDVLDLEGTVVPAYTINSVLGNVPLLGPLLVGRDGEGIFGVTYAVKGATDNPSVIVNPLSVIAPGVLRRLFEFGSSLPPEKAPSLLPPAESTLPPLRPSDTGNPPVSAPLGAPVEVTKPPKAP